MAFVSLIATIALLAYLLGSIPFGLLVSRSQGIDIRQHGSGNIGATNVWRVMGKKSGLAVFIADLLKGVIAVVAAKWIAAHWPIHVQDPGFAGITAALGCILGHNFPIWLRFKGGKGVATSLGVIFGMMPLAALAAFAIWGVTFKMTRYVSLASIVASFALPAVVWILRFAGRPYGDADFYFAVAAGLLVVLRHRSNLHRLVAGTEHRFGSTPPGVAADHLPPLDP